MTAAVELTEKELEELRLCTNRDDAGEALQVAAREFIRFAKRMRLKELSGAVVMEKNWPELEARETGEDADR